MYTNVYYHFVRWRNHQHKSCRSQWVLQLCCWWLIHLKSFNVSKYCLKLPHFEIQILNYSNKVGWKNDQSKSCGYRWVLQIFCWCLFHLSSFNISIYLYNIFGSKIEKEKTNEHWAMSGSKISITLGPNLVLPHAWPFDRNGQPRYIRSQIKIFHIP
jgi:hypothetical protein